MVLAMVGQAIEWIDEFLFAPDQLSERRLAEMLKVHASMVWAR